MEISKLTVSRLPRLTRRSICLFLYCAEGWSLVNDSSIYINVWWADRAGPLSETWEVNT